MTLTASELKDAVNATMGKGTITMASDKKFEVSYIPTGILPIDILLQGGVPRGRYIMTAGEFSTLKSYVALSICRETQKLGGTAAYIDTEHTFEPEWAKEIGVNVEDLIMHRPETGEEAVDIMEILIRGGIDFIVFDSVAATLPLAEQDKALSKDKIQPGRIADLMSKAMRKLTAANKNTTIFFINQTREKIGVTFGSNVSLPGGKALPYYASYIFNMRKTGKITRDVKFYDGEKWVGGKEQIGQKFKAELTKSKLNKPFRDIWFDWNLEMGQIDIPGFMLSQGLELGLITQTGNTWEYANVKAIGRAKFSAALAGNEDAMMMLEDQIREAHDLPIVHGVVVAVEPPEPTAKPKRAPAVKKVGEPAKKATKAAPIKPRKKADA